MSTSPLGVGDARRGRGTTPRAGLAPAAALRHAARLKALVANLRVLVDAHERPTHALRQRHL